MADPTYLADRTRELADAIRQAADNEESRCLLLSGQIPPDLESAIARYSSARGLAKRSRTRVGITALEATIRAVALDLAKASGRVPSVRTVAKKASCGFSSARRALVRMHTEGLWPDGIVRPTTPNRHLRQNAAPKNSGI